MLHGGPQVRDFGAVASNASSASLGRTDTGSSGATSTLSKIKRIGSRLTTWRRWGRHHGQEVGAAAANSELSDDDDRNDSHAKRSWRRYALETMSAYDNPAYPTPGTSSGSLPQALAHGRNCLLTTQLVPIFF